MSEPTSVLNSEPNDELFAELADDFVRRYRAGEQPTVDEYANKHPELADRIRELFPAVIEMEQRGLGATSDFAPPIERVGSTIGVSLAVLAAAAYVLRVPQFGDAVAMIKRRLGRR